MSDQNNPMKPVYEKPRKGGQTYRDKTAEEAIGRADSDRKKTWEQVLRRD